MGQASVYKRAGSGFWYAAIERADGTRVNVSTKIRWAEPGSEKRAREWAALKMQEAGTLHISGPERWENWVPGFIARRYPHALTRKNVENRWSWVAQWLHELRLLVPAAVEYRHMVGYVAWRTGQRRKNGNCITRNTALEDLKVFMVVMREAVLLGYCAGNPVRELEFGRDPVRELVPLSDAEVAALRAECAAREGHLPLVEQWMTTSLETALHQFCRLRETQIPLERIDWLKGEIKLRTKGIKDGQPRWLVVPIHPDLRPRLEAIAAAGGKRDERQVPCTCVLPRMAALRWWQVRQKLGIGHTTFHSTRATGITRLKSAGVPEGDVMKLAGHNSPLVNRIYHKPTTEGLLKQLRKLRFPKP